MQDVLHKWSLQGKYFKYQHFLTVTLFCLSLSQEFFFARLHKNTSNLQYVHVPYKFTAVIEQLLGIWQFIGFWPFVKKGLKLYFMEKDIY